MDGIEKVLGWFGIICIAGGILFGGYNFFSLDNESYKEAKEYAYDISDPEYQAVSAIYHAELSFALSLLFGGLTIGLFFLGFAKLLRLVEENHDTLNGKLGDINRNIIEAGTHQNAS